MMQKAYHDIVKSVGNLDKQLRFKSHEASFAIIEFNIAYKTVFYWNILTYDHFNNHNFLCTSN